MSKKLSIVSDIQTEDVFKVILDYEIGRAKRYPTPMSLLCMEILPSSSNPETLQTASNLFAFALNKYMRSADIPCVNGREFKILLPATDQDGLHSTCERMLSTFSQEFETEDGNTITFALYMGGVTQTDEAILSRNELLDKGLSALNESKQKGVNTYVILK